MDHHFFSFRNCKSQCKTQNKKFNSSGITYIKYSRTRGQKQTERKSDRERQREEERHTYGP